MNRYLVFGVVVVIFTIGYVMIEDNPNKKGIVTKEEKVAQENSQEKIVKKSIEILYLDEAPKERKVFKEDSDLIEKKISNNITKTEKVSKEAIENFNQKELENYIKKRELKEVSIAKNNQQQKYKIYANITIEEAKKSKNQMIPPNAPVFYQTTTKYGNNMSTIIDGDLKQQAQEIVIVDSDTQEATQVELQPTVNESEENTNQQESATFIAPPSIGQ